MHKLFIFVLAKGKCPGPYYSHWLSQMNTIKIKLLSIKL